MTRFSPTWWASWTCALHRPGRYDDEEIPAGVKGVTPWWWHVDTSQVDWSVRARRDRETRPDWPTMEHAQRKCEPTPTDSCNVNGRCVGTCDASADQCAH